MVEQSDEHCGWVVKSHLFWICCSQILWFSTLILASAIYNEHKHIHFHHIVEFHIDEWKKKKTFYPAEYDQKREKLEIHLDTYQNTLMFWKGENVD